MSVTAATALAMEVERATSGRSPAATSKTVRDVLDLFIAQSLYLREPEVAIFDEVFLRLLPQLDLRDKIALAERLADIDNAPRKLVGRLALSEPAVAIPILERSMRLSEQDLITICSTMSSAHLLALANRPRLSAGVTDQILLRASREVLRSLVGNAGARFSDVGLKRLIEKAGADDLLFQALEAREDLPVEALDALISASLEEVRTLLGTDLTGVDPRRPDDILASMIRACCEPQDLEGETFRSARLRVRNQILEADLTPQTLLAWLGEDDVASADIVVALGQLARVDPAVAASALYNPLTDGLILIARLADLTPDAADALFAYRTALGPSARPLAMDLAVFARLSRQTAKCVLRHMTAVRTFRDRR